MKWTVLNALGGMSWLVGLECAKGANLPIDGMLQPDEHRFAISVLFSLVGLSVLLWANIRTPA